MRADGHIYKIGNIENLGPVTAVYKNEIKVWYFFCKYFHYSVIYFLVIPKFPVLSLGSTKARGSGQVLRLVFKIHQDHHYSCKSRAVCNYSFLYLYEAFYILSRLCIWFSTHICFILNSFSFFLCTKLSISCRVYVFDSPHTSVLFWIAFQKHTLIWSKV